jgi:L-alanine-DL-glutamate epimerase-like enolase superfamily enzyme
MIVAHSAASRVASDSVFLKCTTDAGAIGFGECLPRAYVTGETRDGAYALLRDRILPKLIGMRFESCAAVKMFLEECDGKAPSGCVSPEIPQTAAWCAVDLALLDAFGHVFAESAQARAEVDAGAVRYSGVLAAASQGALTKLSLLFRLYGLQQVKMKVGWQGDRAAAGRVRRILGDGADLRVDANMAWDVAQAAGAMNEMSRLGIRCFEQPVKADAVEEMASLVRETGLGVMADESFSDRPSLERLIDKKACTAVNVRISKCGGLVAALRRCRQARRAGLLVQVGCQVGESSLLSAAQLALLAQGANATYIEGCFGRRLLREDVAGPVLQFGYGGRPPALPMGSGLGVRVDESRLRRWTIRHDRVGER